MTNLEYYLPLLINDRRYSAHPYGISVNTAMGEWRDVCSFNTRDEFIDWYNSEYTGKTKDPL